MLECYHCSHSQCRRFQLGLRPDKSLHKANLVVHKRTGFVDRNHDKSCRSCSEETLLYDILAYEDENTAALLLGRPGLAETTFLEEKSSNWEIPKRVDTSDKLRCTRPIRPGSVKILLLAPLAFTVQTT